MTSFPSTLPLSTLRPPLDAPPGEGVRGAGGEPVALADLFGPSMQGGHPIEGREVTAGELHDDVEGDTHRVLAALTRGHGGSPR